MLARAAAAIVLLAPALAAGVELTAGAGVGSRRLFYRDALTPSLRGYEAKGFPVLSLSASDFPLRDPTFGEVGFEARFSGATGLSSRTADGRSVPTSFHRIEAGAALHLFSGLLQPGLSLRWGSASFSLDGSRGPAEAYPAYDYSYARAGGELALVTGVVRASLEVAYLAVLDAGALADRFTRDDVRGVDAATSVRIRLSSILEAGLRFSYTHFAHAMKPLATDALVAGGALDQYLGATAEVILTP